MKEYPSANPKIGPTEKTKQGDLNFEHHMLHGVDKMAPGDRVKLVIHGHIHDNHAEDDFGPGHVHIKVHDIQHHADEKDGQKPIKKPNTSEMKLEELKQHITDLTDKRQNMEGHSESGIKEGEE